MPTAGQVCAGHTHAPRLEGKSSCPAGGTSPKGKAKAKGGLPLPDSPSKAGFGVSPLWRGTHLEGTLQKSFSYAFRLRFQAQRNQPCLCAAVHCVVLYVMPNLSVCTRACLNLSRSVFCCMWLWQEFCPSKTGHTLCMLFSWLG